MLPIQLSIFSEIDRLQQVVVHRPGPEVDLMVPSMMEELLFDDILSGDLARQEHGVFCQVLSRVAEEVLDIQDLFVESMEREEVKLAFIEDLRLLVDLPEKSCHALRGLPPRDVARSLITGIPWDDPLLHTHWQKNFDYRLKPIPNLLFMRDPAAVVGHGYDISFMATWARAREPLLLSYVFRHHPRLAHLEEAEHRLFDQVTPLLKGEIRMPQSLEGGDTLVLSDKVLAVGCSQRTSADAIHMLAGRLREDFRRGKGTFETLLMVLMPKSRSAMHLDTIFTRISRDECLVFPPLFTGDSALLNVVKFDLRQAHMHTTMEPSLLRVLQGVGIDLKPLRCGGGNDILQRREQWTDGANAFCLAPGVIVLYSRNQATAEELSEAGYRILTAGALLADPSLDPLDGGKYAILLESAELSRARGGPRCMTMPLTRTSTCKAPS